MAYVNKSKVLSHLAWYAACKGKNYNQPLLSMDEIAGLISEVSDADVVEVVRCKDCKHAEVCQTQCGATYIECQSHEVYMEADDFCSYGERKSE